MKKLAPVVVTVAILALGFGVFRHYENVFLGWCRWLTYCEIPASPGKTPPIVIEHKRKTDVVATVLTSAQQMNQITVFAARLVAVTQTVDHTYITKDRYLPALDQRNILIAPGSVRYDIEFKNMQSRNFYWDEKANKLWIVIEDPVPNDVNIDERETKTFKDGISVPWVGDDERNHKRNLDAAYADIKKQASSPLLLNLARETGRTAIKNNFLLPLRVAGIDAEVIVRFPSDAKKLGTK